MKKQFTLTILASCLMGLSATSFAQNSDAVNPNQALNLGQANNFEKEVTPLLREISLKKSILELRKVERDIEKLDEEALKAQIEREQLLNPAPKPFETGPMGGIPFGQGNRGGAVPLTVPGQNGAVPANNVAATNNSVNGVPANPNNQIKILMIYGFNDNLHAKVSAGVQGGFVVKEGDVMPDGRFVRKITQNYLEVSDKSKGKSKIEKIFVSYTPAPLQTNNMGLGQGMLTQNLPTNPNATMMPPQLAPIPPSYAPPAPFLMR